MTYVKTFIDMPTAAAAPAKPLEATIFVAASDARAEVKALADFVCTGSNDDVTIEQAINSLPASGGRVVLSEGNFVLGAAIDILRSDVTLEGQGAGTVIKGAIDIDTGYITVGDGTTALSNIKIANLTIDGTGSTCGSGIYFYGSDTAPITNSIIENCWIKNCYDFGICLEYANNNTITGNNCQSNSEGILLRYANNNTITGNNCQSNSDSGIYLFYSNNNTITGNNCQSNTVHGIYIVYSNNDTITGNNCQSNGERGIFIEGSSNNTVTGNNCQSNNLHGINVQSSSNNTITGNNCQSNGRHGIYINLGSNNNTVTGNILKDNSQSLYNAYDDINIYLESYRNIISSNIMIATATNKTRYAVNESEGDYNIVTGNYCSGQVTGKINLTGLNSIATNNLEV